MRAAEGKVSAGIVEVACRVGESYGLQRASLLRVAGLRADDLVDPGARLPSEAVTRLAEHMLLVTGDRSLGLRFAEAMDLRTQGFWGYLFISCLGFRQAAHLLVRFSRLRHASPVRFWEDDAGAVLEWASPSNMPGHLECIAGDAFLACFCYNRLRWMRGARGPLQAWLSYPEEPHHQALRKLVGGPITFEAPFNRCRFGSTELQQSSLASDPHLHRLSELQLERQLAELESSQAATDLSERVRAQLRARLRDGVSLEQVALDLRVSERTLRRRLHEAGVSFQQLLEQVRFDAAVDYLTRQGEGVARVAERLGYGDTSNFRRAFRRWTGLSPALFRKQHESDRARGNTQGAS